MNNEKRLIDVDTARHDIAAHMAAVIYRGIGFIPSGKDSESSYEFLRGYEAGAQYIANLVLQDKYLVDAVSVIRCKECKKWEPHNMPFDITKGTCNNPKFHLHYGHAVERCFKPITKETDFCSYGERREGE